MSDKLKKEFEELKQKIYKELTEGNISTLKYYLFSEIPKNNQVVIIEKRFDDLFQLF